MSFALALNAVAADIVSSWKCCRCHLTSTQTRLCVSIERRGDNVEQAGRDVRLPSTAAFQTHHARHKRGIGVKSCRHMVRKRSQKPVTASHAMANPTVMISG